MFLFFLKKKHEQVPGSRFTDKYLSMRYSTPPPSYSFTGSGPPLPSRKDTPSRKTLSSFATFNADSKLSNASIMNTPVGNTGNTATSFSGIDTSSRRINDDDMDDDDDDDDDDDESPERRAYSLRTRREKPNYIIPPPIDNIRDVPDDIGRLPSFTAMQHPGIDVIPWNSKNNFGLGDQDSDNVCLKLISSIEKYLMI